MSKMSIAELAKAVAAKHGLTQENAETFVSMFFDVVNDGLHAEKSVKVRGLGTFKVVDVRERESVNVNTGERVMIEGHGKISYTPDPIMRDLVNKPFAKFDTVILNDGVAIDELNNVDSSSIIDNPDDETDETPVYVDEVATGEPVDNPEQPVGEEDIAVDETVDNVVESKEQNTAEEQEAAVIEEKDVVDDKEDATPDNRAEIVAEEEVAAEPVKSIFNKVETTPEVFSETVAFEPELLVPTDEPEVATEQAEPNRVDKSVFDDDSSGFFKRNKTIVACLAVLLFGVIAFAGGYLLGQSMASRPIFKTVKVYNVPKSNTFVRDTTQVSDTANAIAALQDEKTLKREIPEKEKASGPEQSVKKDPVAPKSSSEINSVVLNNARRQVQTGAYTITGTAQTVTVKKGQTLAHISRLYLGEGMDCYVQVHNGVSGVNEGMKVKIPQLKLKKRR